jgi:hypothetical protein
MMYHLQLHFHVYVLRTIIHKNENDNYENVCLCHLAICTVSYSALVFCMDIKILPGLHFATFMTNNITFSCSFYEPTGTDFKECFC